MLKATLQSNSRNKAKSRKSHAAPGRPRSDDAHRAILSATLELLADIGYERLTISGVATKAGVGKATIYRRWPSKLPLVMDAFEELPTLKSPDTGSLIDDLEELLKDFVHSLNSTPLALVLAAIGGERAHDAALAKRMAPVFKARRQPLMDVLERSVARNELPPDLNLDAAADVVMGPIVNRIFFTGNNLDENHIRPFIEAALFGINRLRK
ncbi:TetR/AcrR family transcriptional regulator [Denitratisoma sp. DHT3]|uniref:TetR/AcrR family transcriptional regulator n=1 Tax=Denitratisoma sp. DHT3 TaxID=1981880 RepID=UPI0016475349|nr:TetR/AcrR family transcriptional regulator [Denitratisoma sp. DHT3]